jgi:hypothetical protein
MPLADALGSAPHSRPTEPAWWLEAPAIQRAIEDQIPEPHLTACFKLGDAVLEMVANDPALLAPVQQLYGDCAVSGADAADLPRVRCLLRRPTRPPLILLTFDDRVPADPAAATFGLLRPTRAVPPYSVRNSPVPGWRLAGGVESPVLAASASNVLIHPLQVPPVFLAEYLVGLVLAAQPKLLPLHAASLSVGGRGLMIVGSSHAGKTTTAIHLAARGHPLLGDEVALVRLASNEIVPFRRTMKLRPGPHDPALEAAAKRLGDLEQPVVEDQWGGTHRIGELFPSLPARPTSLRAVFFLRRFAERPALEPFQLRLGDADIFDWLATPEIAYTSWGLAPERRALRMLALRQMLARVPCWLLDPGTPGETAEVIERTMEELGC